MITDERRDKALQFLVNTDESAATSRAYMLGLEKQEKTILATELLKSEQKTGPLREAEARVSDVYKEWRKVYENALFDFEIAKNRRNTAALVIECWRSENANRRKGNL